MKVKRINEIEEYIRFKQQVSLNELKDKFNVSINTIRRDINELESSNIISKVYGGVVYNNEEATVAYEQRNIDHLFEKQQIGEYCSKFIKRNDIVFIDSGTTTHFILDKVDKHLPFTLISNSLEVINKATQFPNITLLIVGNTYKRTTKSFIGITDNHIIDKFNINKAFMSATAFSIDQGASNSDLLENETKQIICQKSNQVYLMVDSSKFGDASLFTYCASHKLTKVITDHNLSADYANKLQEAGIETIQI